MKTINTREIEKIPIAIYRKVTDKQGKIIEFHDFFDKCIPASEDLVNELRSITGETYKEKHDEQQNFKVNNLPAAAISCLCGESKDIVIKRNDLIVLDIDPGDNQTMFNDEELQTIKQKLFALPYVYAVALSASGNGLFVVIPISNTDNEKFKSYFKALEKELKEQFNVSIDVNCKNVNRLRYFTFDKCPLIKKNQDIEYYEKLYVEEEIEKQEIKVQNFYHNDDDPVYDDKFLYQTVKALLNNGFTADNYKTWLIQGFMLAVLGEMGRALFNDISINSGNYKGYDDVCRQFNICLKKTTFTREKTAVYYFGIAKKMFGNDWKNIVKLTKI